MIYTPNYGPRAKLGPPVCGKLATSKLPTSKFSKKMLSQVAYSATGLEIIDNSGKVRRILAHWSNQYCSKARKFGDP